MHSTQPYPPPSATLPALIAQQSPARPAPDAGLRVGLCEWIEAAPDGAELAGRNEAVRRLMLCFEHHQPALDLSHLGLTDLPTLTARFDWLTRIDLSHNRLDKLPEGLLELPRLSVLDLRNNALNHLPARLADLPRDCAVVLAGNPLRPAMRESWRGPQRPNLIFDRPGPETFAQVTLRPAPPPTRPPAHTADDAARSARLSLLARLRRQLFTQQALVRAGMGDDHALLRALDLFNNYQVPLLSCVIDTWRASAGGFGALLPKLEPALRDEIETTPHADSFALWLSRLEETADHRHPLRRAALHGRVFRILKACIDTPDLRGVFFNIAEEASETCGDNIALGLNQMDLALTNWHAERSGLDGAQILQLGRARHALEELQRISRAHAIAARREQEAVEVELAFQVACASGSR